MRPNRPKSERLRGAFQDQMDRFEQRTGEQFDRLAERGTREYEQLKRDLKRELREEWRNDLREDFGDAAGAMSRRAGGMTGRDLHRAKRRIGRHLKRELKREAKRAARRPPRRRRRFRRRSETAEEKHLRRARRRVNHRIAFTTHLASFVGTLAILLVTTRSLRVVSIVGVSWGLGVFLHYLFAVWAPSWRDRSVEEEVGAHSPRAVAHVREKVETRSRRSMEDLSASIAKEIRNPITAAKHLVQRMGEDPAADDNLEFATEALSELDRVERSIAHLLRYARDEEPRLTPVSLRSVAEAATRSLAPRATEDQVALELFFKDDAPLRGDGEKLQSVLENLISNALDAFALSRRPGRFAASGVSRELDDPMIEVAGGEDPERNEVWISVADNGPGVPEEERERIWSPFFTTKETGAGLGLALTRKTIEAHGGRIELLVDGRRGSEFLMSFPSEGSSSSAEGEEHVR